MVEAGLKRNSLMAPSRMSPSESGRIGTMPGLNACHDG